MAIVMNRDMKLILVPEMVRNVGWEEVSLQASSSKQTCHFSYRDGVCGITNALHAPFLFTAYVPSKNTLTLAIFDCDVAQLDSTF